MALSTFASFVFSRMMDDLLLPTFKAFSRSSPNPEGSWGVLRLLLSRKSRKLSTSLSLWKREVPSEFLQALALDLRFCKNPFCWVILKECLNIHLHSKRRCHKWNGQSIEIILFHLGFPELSFCFEVFAVWLLILLTKGNFQNQKMSLTKHPESKKMKEASEEVNEALSFTEFFLTHSAIISVFPLQSLRLTILGGFSSFKQNRQMPDSLQLSSFQATFKRMTPSTLLWFL